MTKRRKFSNQFKAKVALEALRGYRTIQEMGEGGIDNTFIDRFWRSLKQDAATKSIKVDKKDRNLLT